MKCYHRDAPWMTNEIKQKLKEKTKIYKKYVKNKFDVGYRQLLNEKMSESSNRIVRQRQLLQKKKEKNYLTPLWVQKNIGQF